MGELPFTNLPEGSPNASTTTIWKTNHPAEHTISDRARLTHFQKELLLKAIFQNDYPPHYNHQSFDRHFEHLSRKIYLSNPSELSVNLLDATVEAIAETIGMLRYLQNKPWWDAFEEIEYSRVHKGSCRHLAEILELALLAWLHVDVKGCFLVSRGTAIAAAFDFRGVPWDWNGSLVDNVKALFPARESRADVMIGKTLPVADLERFYGVEVVGTPHLNEHLKFNEGKKYGDVNVKPTLKVYLDPAVLNTLDKRELDDESAACPFPPGLLEEVYDSLGLLFPREYSEAYKRFIPEASGGPRRARLSHYSYLNDRIARLVALYNSPPIRWWHPLLDRRNRREHFMLWMVIFAFVFALLGLAAGSLSAAFAVMRYSLGVAAACAESGDHPGLASYCG